MGSRFGRIQDSDPLDRYYSPPYTVELLLEWIGDSEVWQGTIAEPCAGDGAIVDVLEAHGRDVVGGDIDPGSPYPEVDATDEAAVLERYRGVDAVVTNPPYDAPTGTAFEVLDTLSVLEVPVAMLCRTSFLEPPKTGARSRCFEESESAVNSLRPVAIGFLPRVDFTGPGGGDNNAGRSCWILWRFDIDYGGADELHWWTHEDVARVQGQTSLLCEEDK